MKFYKVFLISILLILTFTFTIFSKTKQSDESRFQVGFGLIINSSNINALIEDYRMIDTLENGRVYDYPGLTDEQKTAISELPVNMRRGIYISNILTSMEYGFQTRFLWKSMIIESNLLLLPYDATYNGKLDLEWTADIGIRAPWFIMPYIMIGANLTFSFYPDYVSNIDSWKTGAVYQNFAFSPGVNLKTGLDFKFTKFSIGLYYQYMIKDFQEFSGWWQELWEGFYYSDIYSTVDDAKNRAYLAIFTSQSRVGMYITFYVN